MNNFRPCFKKTHPTTCKVSVLCLQVVIFSCWLKPNCFFRTDNSLLYVAFLSYFQYSGLTIIFSSWRIVFCVFYVIHIKVIFRNFKQMNQYVWHKYSKHKTVSDRYKLKPKRNKFDPVSRKKRKQKILLHIWLHILHLYNIKY